MRIGVEMGAGRLDAAREQAWAQIRRARAWAATADGKRLLAVLALTLAVRLVIAPFHGFFHDLQAYVRWGRIFDHDPFHFYSVASSVDVLTSYRFGYLPNYPPLTVYLYGVLDGIYVAVAHLFGIHPALDVHQSWLAAVYMRLPILAADLGMVAIIYTLARRARSPRWATLAAGAYALSPAVLFDGVLWAQTDTLPALAIVLALLCTLRRRGVPAGMLYAVAVLFKPQPFIFAPLILLYLWRWAGRSEALRALAAMAATGIAICFPYLLPPRPEILIFLQSVQHVALSKAFATVDAFNFWWFIGGMHQSATAPYLGPLSATGVGWVLFGAVLLITFAGIWRDASAERLFLGGALLATAFFDMTTLQHERYLCATLALFLLAAIYNARHLVFYIVATVGAFLNMAMAVLINANPPDGFPSDPGVNLNAQWDYFIHHGEPTLGVAALNVWLLLMVVILYLRVSPTRAGTQPKERAVAAQHTVAEVTEMSGARR